MLHVHHCHLTLRGATRAKSSFKPLEVEDARTRKWAPPLTVSRARSASLVDFGSASKKKESKAKPKEPPGQILISHPHCTCQATGVSRTGEKGITIRRHAYVGSM